MRRLARGAQAYQGLVMLRCQSIAHCPPVWGPGLEGTLPIQPRLLQRREHLQLDDIQEPLQGRTLSSESCMQLPHSICLHCLSLRCQHWQRVTRA